MIRSVIVPARVHIQLLWMIMEYYVDYILIAPSNLQLIFLVNGDHIVRPSKFPHPRQIHQHHARIYTQFAVIWMPSKSVIPASIRILVLRTESCQLAGVHLLELIPDLLRWCQKQSVCVHIEHRVRVIQHSLKMQVLQMQFY